MFSIINQIKNGYINKFKKSYGILIKVNKNYT